MAESKANWNNKTWGKMYYSTYIDFETQPVLACDGGDEGSMSNSLKLNKW